MHVVIRFRKTYLALFSSENVFDGLVAGFTVPTLLLVRSIHLVDTYSSLSFEIQIIEFFWALLKNK